MRSETGRIAESTTLNLERLEPRTLLGAPVGIAQAAPPTEVASFDSPYGSARVTVYDTDSTADVSADDVSVHFGRDGSVGAVVLRGDQPMEGLGITVSGATRVGRIIDARRGDPGAVSFIAGDSAVGGVSLRSGITGHDLNGLDLGGLSFAADVDGDGDTTDTTGLYAGGYLGSLTARGAVSADVVADGRINAAFVVGGDLGGDVRAVGGDLGRVVVRAGWDRGTRSWVGGGASGVIRAGGRIGSVVTVRGDLNGAVGAGGDVGLVKAVRGDVGADVSAGGRVNAVVAVNGSVSGEISATGDLRVVRAVGGDVAGRLSAGGSLRAAAAIERAGAGGGITGGIEISGDVGVLKAIRGDIVGRIDVPGDLRTVIVFDGDITGDVVVGGDLGVLKSIGRNLSVDVNVGGNAGVIQAVRGSILDGDGDGESVDVTGRLNRLSAFGWQAGQGVIEGRIRVGDDTGTIRAVGGDITATVETGNLARISVVGGSVRGDLHVNGRLGSGSAQKRAGSGGGFAGLIDVEADIGSLSLAGGSLARPLNVGGSLGSLRVAGADLAGTVTTGNVAGPGNLRSVAVSGGNLEGNLLVPGHLGTVRVMGAMNGDLTVGGDLENLLVSGDLTGEVSTGGDLLRVSVGGDADGAGIDATGQINSLWVGGRVSGSSVTGEGLRSLVIQGRLEESTLDFTGGGVDLVWVVGDLDNSTITADELELVLVLGDIRQDGDGDDDDVIRARDDDRFFVRDAGWAGWLFADGESEHWFGGEPDGLRAFVG